MYKTCKKASAPVLAYDIAKDDAKLFWKNGIVFQLVGFGDGECVQAHRVYGKRRLRGYQTVEDFKTTRVLHFEAKTNGEVHILLHVSGPHKRDCFWYHVACSTSDQLTRDVVWGKLLRQHQ